MKLVLSLFFLLAASLAFAADSVDDPEAMFLRAYAAFRKAETSKSAADATQNYREADKFLKLLREKYPQWNKHIVAHRAEKVAKGLKRLENPRYFSHATIQLKRADSTDEQGLRAHLPKNDPSVTFRGVAAITIDSTLFEIGVTATEPNAAASRANELAAKLQSILQGEAPPKTLIIWEKAKPPTAPMTPKELQ